jgi:hypothetical protein
VETAADATRGQTFRWRRTARRAFWIGVPASVATVLFWPSHSVLYVGDDPFSLVLNPVRSALPPPLDDISFFYPATVLSLGILALCALTRRACGVRYEAWPPRLPTFFLPTYLAAIESIDLLSRSMRCHSMTAPAPLDEVLAQGVVLTAAACAVTILAGALAASACGHRSRGLLPVPGVIFPIVAGALLPWWLVWSVFLGTP